MTNLSNYIIQEIPEVAFYIPNYITIEEEEQLLKNIYSSPKPKWTQLSNRRLQQWGGVPHIKGMIPEEIPKWLQYYVEKVNSLDLFDKPPNHVLINEYLSGQGIMAHLDGPLFYPTVATITCGSHTVLNLYNFKTKEPSTEKVFSLLLERRSLVILQKDIYNKFMHGIDEIEQDTIDDRVMNLNICNEHFKIGQVVERSTRVSLTIRHVPKTSSFKLKF